MSIVIASIFANHNTMRQTEQGCGNINAIYVECTQIQELSAKCTQPVRYSQPSTSKLSI